MQVLRRLSRASASISVVLPRQFANHLEWKVGQSIVVELLEDGTLWLRRPTSRDYQAMADNRAPEPMARPPRLRREGPRGFGGRAAHGLPAVATE